MGPVEEIGLFPLGIVLLPTEQVPLHIFEPRYKELIGECLEQGREFGLVYTDDDGVREIGTRAAVTEVLDELPDGRMNVVVEGGERFHVVRMTEGRSFQTAEVEPVEDEDDTADPDDAERASGLLRELAELTGTEFDEEVYAGDSFGLGARVDFGAARKQKLLELTSERRRMKALVKLLEHAVSAASYRRELRERAARNGRVEGR